MRVVAALGGNALLARAERPDAEVQERHVLRAVESLVPLARAHQLVVTHGNGPQVGLLATESEKDTRLSHPFPFDVLGAQTQGMIGYWLLQAIENALPGRGVGAILTQTVVTASDPAFAEPTKFIGPWYDEDLATRLSAERGWVLGRDEERWRRVVPSPEPREIVELGEIESLLARGSVVVCAGGGGIPVVRTDKGLLAGIEAVVDKDLTSGMLAERLHADALLLLTDVRAVELDHGSPRARPLHRATVTRLRALSFPAGSMGPKVEAACRFVSATGRPAVIGRLDEAERLLAGAAGTLVQPG